MKRRLAVACALLLAAACGKSTQKRTDRDAAAVQVVTQPVLGDGGTAAQATDEIEPNDGDDTATALAIGGTVRAKIEPDTDVDTFKIAVTETGALAVDVTGIDGVDLILEIEDMGGTVIAKSDRGGARIKEGVPNVGVSAGTYRAVVKMKKSPPPKSKKKKKGKAVDAGIEIKPAPVYEISARMVAPVANSEREPDDDRGTAIDLIVGDTVTGFVGWSGDDDVWKLSVETLSEKNSIDIEVGAVEGVALSIDVSDGIGNPLVTRKGPRGQPLIVRGIVPIVPEGAPPFHYVTIKGDRSNPETPYQLRVVAKVPQPDAEIEPNDVPDKAMPVPTDRTVVHGVWTPGDVDCFAIGTDAAARTVDITIDVPPESDLDAELLVDGKSVAKGDKKGKGVVEKLTGQVPANAHAVIRVKGPDSSGEGAYDVQIAEGPPAP
ncbi:MAG: hypothetical protein AB7T06_23650 [Kofleriaceae bacterium]